MIWYDQPSKSSICWLNSMAYAKNPLHTFPRNFLVDGEVTNLLATSRCNGIWETTRYNRHNGLLPAPTCYRLVADLSFILRTCYGEVANRLRSCYGETGVMDFGLYVKQAITVICADAYVKSSQTKHLIDGQSSPRLNLKAPLAGKPK